MLFHLESIQNKGYEKNKYQQLNKQHIHFPYIKTFNITNDKIPWKKKYFFINFILNVWLGRKIGVL